MRILAFILILYACISLFAPGLNPLSSMEATGLLLYRPWSAFWEALGGPETTGAYKRFEEPPGFERPFKPEPPGLLWWERVFRCSLIKEEFCLAGARSRITITPDLKRIPLLAGTGPLIRPGDPVLWGECLVGFVGEFQEASSIPLVLLNDPSSRAVVGALHGTVAGSEIFFVTGGASPEMEGGIRVRFPSSRFGFREGSQAVTGFEPLLPGLPPGLVLGKVHLTASGTGGGRGAPVLIPALPTTSLDRVAVLLPRDRVKGGRMITVPDLALNRIPVGIRLWTGGRQGKPFFHVSAGSEKGISQGDLLVAGGFALARLTRVGLFASEAALLVAPDPFNAVKAVYFSEEDGPCFFQMRILAREGLRFQVEADRRLSSFVAGRPIYLVGQPCSGLEDYPAFYVVEPGDGRAFTLGIPWDGKKEACYCLSAVISSE